MGDRAVIEIHQEGGTVCLYSHSDGLHLRKVLAKALNRGFHRWDDQQYLTRIIFSEMTKGHEMATIGYGIHVGDADDLGPDNPTIYLDWSKDMQLDISCSTGTTNHLIIFTPTEWIEKYLP